MGRHGNRLGRLRRLRRWNGTGLRIRERVGLTAGDCCPHVSSYAAVPLAIPLRTRNTNSFASSWTQQFGEAL